MQLRPYQLLYKLFDVVDLIAHTAFIVFPQKNMSKHLMDGGSTWANLNAYFTNFGKPNKDDLVLLVLDNLQPGMHCNIESCV